MGYATQPLNGPGGPERDSADDARLRHARDQHLGFPVGRYLQPPPMLFTRDGHNVFLGDMYRGSSAFLLCSGPSLTSHDLSKLGQRGILTCALNNAAAVVRPNLWVSVDDPGNFVDAVWRDPAVTKFVPLCHMEKRFSCRLPDGTLAESSELVGDMPAVFGYRRNEAFQADQFLYEDTFNWGNHSDRRDDYGIRGSRSVMLIALRLLFYLGVRQLFLLGCDFRMKYGEQNYAFEQDRSRSSVSGNNKTFEALNVRLQHLLPAFQREGYTIYNCTPQSGLTVFPHLPYEAAVEQAMERQPRMITTAGMYDRERKSANGRSETYRSPAAAWTSEQLRQEESRLPPTTLITHLDEKSSTYLSSTWRSWMRHHPWLSQIPAVVLCAPGVDLNGVQASLEPLKSDVQFVPLSDEQESLCGRDAWGPAVLRYVAQQIRTPWFLRLEPEAIATSDALWLDPSWFVADPSEPDLAFVSCPWGYSKPSAVLEQLDRWGDQTPGIRQFAPLHVPFDPSADRVEHQSLNSWMLLGSTEWAQQTLQYVEGPLPCKSFDTFLAYCAQRRGDRFILRQMKDFGWDHSFRDARWIIRRCEKAMNPV